MIARLRAWRQWQPFADGPYACSGGSADGLDSTIVAIDHGDGGTGWGEAAPLGSFYGPAFAAGCRAGVAEMAPLLVGGPVAPRLVNRRLATTFKGHPYAKSAIDMALWDLAARRAGVPLVELLGGRDGAGVDLYRSISAAEPAEMAERARELIGRGYRRLQVKVGVDPAGDAACVLAVRDAVGPDIVVFADANGLYSTAAARRFLRALGGADVWIEQPCATLAECRAVRSHCDRPLVLDESIDSLEALLAAHRDGVADGVTLKIARLGGVTPTTLVRDVAVDLGLHVTIEDTGGADIDTAACAHLSLSTPAALRLHTVDFNAWVAVSNATGMPAPVNGQLSVGAGAGLGVEVDSSALGEPFVDLRV